MTLGCPECGLLAAHSFDCTWRARNPTIATYESGKMTMTPIGAVLALPASIRIAGFDIKIERWTILEASAQRRWGEWSSMEHTIRIQEDMPSRFKVVDTFLHEVMHAIYWAYNIDEKDDEERTVAAFGTALMTLHRDNPWLAKWLNEALA